MPISAMACTTAGLSSSAGCEQKRSELPLLADECCTTLLREPRWTPFQLCSAHSARPSSDGRPL